MFLPTTLQIHFLASYPASLPNRDEHGFAKRLLFGGTHRLRISSQCLKRHWRMSEGPHSIHSIEGATSAVRSRLIVERAVIAPLRESDAYESAMLDAVEESLNKCVYGASGANKESRQPLLLGVPEVQYIAMRTKEVCDQNPKDAKAAVQAVEALFSERKGEGKNFKAMLQNVRIAFGLEGAFFGRMVTSDPESNIESAVNVAHALSVHEIESEQDYFTVVDDLQNRNEPGAAAHLSHSELTSGLYYGYVVVHMPTLVSNLEACPAEDWLKADHTLAAQALTKLIYTIATVTPAAKVGSTAPFGYAEFMMLEADNHQPRTLMNAFRKQVASAQTDDAVRALMAYMNKVDTLYGKTQERVYMSFPDVEMQDAQAMTVQQLAGWAANVVLEAKEEA